MLLGHSQHQGAVEKLYKAKLDQEKLALKVCFDPKMRCVVQLKPSIQAKEKYKNDCVSINGLTAQTSLTQGRDLDKVSLPTVSNKRMLSSDTGICQAR